VIFKKEYFFYFFIYLFASIFLLTTQGLFWDDWVVFHVDPSAVLNLYTMSGRPLFGHFFNSLFAIDPDGFIIFRVLIFSCFLIPLFLLDRILLEISEITTYERVSLVALFSVIPVNSSRIAITMAQYSFCQLLFYVAFFVTVYFIKSKNIFLRLLALGLFYVSFTMDSLLVFYAIVLLFIFYKENGFIRYENKWKLSIAVKNISIKYIDFILLPIVYLGIKSAFFQPYGLYANYNKITVFNLAKSIFRIVLSILESLKPILKECLIVATNFPIIHILGAILIFILLKSLISNDESIKSRKLIRNFLIIGFGIIGLAIFPYYVVNAVPGMNNWSSRHQVLMPLGCSVLVLFSIELIASYFPNVRLRVARLGFLAVVLTSFIITTLHSHLQYQKDWFKQLSMISQFKENELMQKHTSFQFVDNTLALNATFRTYNFYEFTGLMKHAFNDETRYGSLDNEFDIHIEGATQHPQYNVSQFKVKPYEVKVNINYGSFELNNESAIKLVWLRIFNNVEFIKSIKNIIKVEAESF
jgi:hypothetical protein